MTIDEKIAMLKRVLSAYDRRIEQFESLVGMKGASGSKGSLVAEYESTIAKLEACIGLATSFYESYKSSQSGADYRSYLESYTMAQDIRQRCESLKDEIEDKRRQRDMMYERQDKIIENIQALKTEKERQEEEESSSSSSQEESSSSSSQEESSSSSSQEESSSSSSQEVTR